MISPAASKRSVNVRPGSRPPDRAAPAVTTRGAGVSDSRTAADDDESSLGSRQTEGPAPSVCIERPLKRFVRARDNTSRLTHDRDFFW